MADRSTLRRMRRDGDTSHDGRGRRTETWPILHYGFRPFFLLASLYAGLAIPLWLWFFQTGITPSGPFEGITWHAHEMLFGYLAAVIAGFILTAIPNWTGGLPLSGAPLAGLVALWAIGRLACAFLALPVAAMLLDLAFPAALAGAVWREIIAGRNWRNAPVAVMLTLFGLASAAHHAEAMELVPPGLAIRLALGVIAMLIALIGGRIIPSFTRNWLARQKASQDGGHLPAPFGRLDRVALLITAISLFVWIVAPNTALTGAALLLAGLLLFIRLTRWRGVHVLGEPIVLVLHVGYFWLAVSLALIGAAVLIPEIVPDTAALHALTAGAVGTMTLAVMTRATLGHTGREIHADNWTILIYAAVTLGALLRVAAPFLSDLYLPALTAGGLAWSLAFLLFAAHYGPMLCRPRLTG